MQHVFSIIAAELGKKPWNSALQLIVAGMIIYYVAMVLGSGYACGPGNSDPSQGVFRCTYGEMAATAKLLIVAGIAAASICLGRAVSLVEKRWLEP